jgi:preprotein translocase subunit SecA
VKQYINDASSPRELASQLTELASDVYQKKVERIGREQASEIERYIMLKIIDERWMQHLQEMDYLKEGVNLRAIGQRDPVVEYKNEAYDMFAALVESINEGFLQVLLRMELTQRPDAPQRSVLQNASYSAPAEDLMFGTASAAAKSAGIATHDQGQIQAAAQMAGSGGATRTVVKDTSDPYANVGRNDPCPCGSGKKYKKCHGAA